MSRRRRRRRRRQRKRRRGECACEREGGTEGEACRAACQETLVGGNTRGHLEARWSEVFGRLGICSLELQNGLREKRKV